MKKFLAVIALVAFLGGISAPVLAADNANTVAMELADKDPKKAKKSETKKTESCEKSEKSCEKSCDKKK